MKNKLKDFKVHKWIQNIKKKLYLIPYAFGFIVNYIIIFLN